MADSDRSIALAKTITWRIVATTTTFLIAWALTGDLTAGAAIGGVEAVAKMGLYYWHERAWGAALGRRARTHLATSVTEAAAAPALVRDASP